MLTRMKKITATVLGVTISLFLCLEITSRAAFFYPPARRRLLGFDSSSFRLNWIPLHRIGQEWTGPFATYDPVRGWALRPNIRQMSLPDGTVLNTNSRGIRGRIEYPYQRTPGTQRVLLLGDSFTFGSEVADDDTYARYLETHLPRTEVINLGVQGYGMDQMLLYLKQEGAKYHPDAVILGFVYIDVYRNTEDFFSFAKPEFQVVDGRLRLTNVPVPNPDQVVAREPYRLKSMDVLSIFWHRLLRMGGWEDKEARVRTEAILEEMVKSSRAMGATPMFVYMPVNEEIAPRLQSRSAAGVDNRAIELAAYAPSLAGREDYLRGICRQQSVRCLFLGPPFRDEASRGVDLHPGHHWNATAHALAGAEIQRFLEDSLKPADSAETPDHPPAVIRP
jgi:hypothetical protein